MGVHVVSAYANKHKIFLAVCDNCVIATGLELMTFLLRVIDSDAATTTDDSFIWCPFHHRLVEDLQNLSANVEELCPVLQTAAMLHFQSTLLTR